MSNVMELIGLKKTEGHLGVEIEVEGNELPNLMGSMWWNTTNDGSLRGESYEYVLKHPVNLEQLREALLELKSAYQNNGSKPTESFRAGVHVHVNCQTLTITELFNFVCLYLIFEKTFIKWCGAAREGNLFCLSASDADFILSAIRENLMISVRENTLAYLFNLFQQGDIIRYSSMNFGALAKYGSLEFRGMRSTPKLRLIHNWAEVLFNLREKAKQYPDCQRVVYEFSVQGIESFIDDVLGPQFSGMFREADPNYHANIMEGIRNAQEIAFSVDWAKVEALAEKPFKVKMQKIPPLVVEDGHGDEIRPNVNRAGAGIDFAAIARRADARMDFEAANRLRAAAVKRVARRNRPMV